MTQPTLPSEAAEQSDLESRISEFLGKSDPEFKEDPPKEEDQDTKGPTQVEAGEEEPVEPGDEGDEETLEAGEEEGEEVVEGEAEEATVETLSDLAKAWEMEEAELLSELKLETSAGDQIPLTDVIRAYETRGDDPESKAFREKVEADRQGEKEASEQHLLSLRQATDQLLTQMESEKRLTDEEWKTLEQEDPVEFSRLKIKENERANAVTRSLQEIEKGEAKRQHENQELRDKIYAEELASLQAKSGKQGLPDWNNKEDGKAAMDLIESQMTDEIIGFSQEEIQAVEDHRFMMVAWYAAKYLETQKQSQKKLSRVRDSKLPKFSKASARRDPSKDGAKKQRTALQKRLTQTGDERDAARLIEELL